MSENPNPAPIRTFATGATRNTDTNKLDYEGFLSPLVLKTFAAYMHKHRKQADGHLRASDNWQKGMGKDVFIKSLFRHFIDLWELHRGLTPLSPETGKPVELTDAIAACLFNLQGYLHEHLHPEKYAALNSPSPSTSEPVNATETPVPPAQKKPAAPAEAAYVGPTTCSNCGTEFYNATETRCALCRTGRVPLGGGRSRACACCGSVFFSFSESLCDTCRIGVQHVSQ